MNKIFLVVQREFLTRVKKKTFLLTTIGLPILIFGLYALIIYFSVESGSVVTVAVADKAQLFNGEIKSDDDKINFQFVNDYNEASLKEKLRKKEFSAYLLVPDSTKVMRAADLKVVSNESIGVISQERIEKRIHSALEKRRLLSLNLTEGQLDSIQAKNRIQFPTLEGDSEKENVAGFSYLIGIVSGFIIYIVLFVYGTMVMRGVMEEKVSRIAEVIISSVKPFQLMMGKILGIGAVGLLQFIIWIVLISMLPLLLSVFSPEMAQQMAESKMSGADISQQTGAMAEALASFKQLPLLLIAGSFLFYFVGGYLLYSSLFAAVGSAVNEDPQDAQSLLFPIMMPIVFGMAIMMKAANDPNSSLAIFGSMFPLTSPIVMMARLPYNPPLWQVFLSYGLLIAGFLLTTWLAAKIYRTGILMYGKKPSWKELSKWAFKRS